MFLLFVVTTTWKLVRYETWWIKATKAYSGRWTTDLTTIHVLLNLQLNILQNFVHSQSFDAITSSSFFIFFLFPVLLLSLALFLLVCSALFLVIVLRFDFVFARVFHRFVSGFVFYSLCYFSFSLPQKYISVILVY